MSTGAMSAFRAAMLVASFHSAASQETSASLENVTKTISNLLDGYDIRLRPNFGGKWTIEI